MTKNIFAWILAIVGIGVIVGGYYYPESSVTYNVAGVSSAGTTFNTAKVAEVSMAPSTASASSTSLLNTDSTDRVVENSYAYCNTVGTSFTYLTGAGLVSLSVNMATSSTAAQTGNTNYAANVTIATSSPTVFSASSTEPALNATGRLWPTGTYLIPTFNATNTAQCIVGVHYLAS